jgi:hypothetical protein
VGQQIGQLRLLQFRRNEVRSNDLQVETLWSGRDAPFLQGVGRPSLVVHKAFSSAVVYRGLHSGFLRWGRRLRLSVSAHTADRPLCLSLWESSAGPSVCSAVGQGRLPVPASRQAGPTYIRVFQGAYAIACITKP